MKKENVLVVSKGELNRHFILQQTSWTIEKSDIDTLKSHFMPRNLAENDFSAKQLIPYALISDAEGRFLTYNRHGSEQRLKGISSVGIGGHVNENDLSVSNYMTLIAGLKREILEEIGIRLNDEDFSLAGMINEDVTEVGHCHIGIVFRVKLVNSILSFNTEIENPQWQHLHDLDFSKFEKWSSLALNLIKEKCITE